MLKSILFLVSTLLVAKTYADDSTAESLYGTWSSKSNQVFTGPGFYDPVDELLIEPSLPGLSYSFTEDGYFEEATYQVSANPKKPGCPVAAVIYQHGTYNISSNGTLVLTPIKVDGRQLLSDPCNDDGTSVYSRYNQTETFKSFAVGVDPYHGIYKLQLYQFDGSPLQPLYLAYRPPMMLPTETLNPTDNSDDSASETGSSNSKRSLSELVKRGLENKHRTNAVKNNHQGFIFSNVFWYVSMVLLGVGSIAFLAY
ncbi:similar to Saccharomyces cerevisiae YMR200W ROT1 Molecular chaperone involved in protein folding in the ER [Maudiozyma saulgeensis]|uniref:Protein ROT1 n=1 Tax=Maudiozyma saulgeensis TaxID=1789683 RepID=A0A1X7QY49_9SACH|nr:similar to Saccharomyces cerevisiae YMR200W ROT1 Molecular chaperone involved in protein folding in the ER [Kazachstania saulgeensis]